MSPGLLRFRSALLEALVFNSMEIEAHFVQVVSNNKCARFFAELEPAPQSIELLLYGEGGGGPGRAAGREQN